MSECIASTYEILGYIGVGGGGNVFLARHIRLEKLVVLKADKRKVTTRPELLRREVDVLKNLSHSYIPKVYDFFAENDTVYTVMDYIDGESMDKLLKRGEKFSQAQVIEWAKELLEALSYLHSPTHGDPPRGYVHSDIKPANLMLTPLNTICLIDFNIALALGEENVVGASAGYASPEHYGLDYSSGFTAMSKTQHIADNSEKTELLEGNFDSNGKTELLSSGSTSSSYSSLKKVVPDVRSDIYSTGATLYHLLCGKRPARSATEVVPLSDKEFSPPLSAIINKAMNPNPDLRYQSADEMLYELEHLHDNDPRVKRLRRGLIAVESVMCAVMALGVFTSFVGLKRMQASENALKLAEYSFNSMAAGDPETALEQALQALPVKKTIFTPEPCAQAQRALANALGVYDLSDGFRAHKSVSLPSAPLNIAAASDGSTFVCICSGEAVICGGEDGEILNKLPTDGSALSEVCYISDSVIVYSGNGAVKAYDIYRKTELWSGEPATALCVSDDGSAVAAVFKDNGYAVIYDAATGEERQRVDFGRRTQPVKFNDTFVNPRDGLLALNKDGTLLAASFSDGSLSVFSAENAEELFRFDEGDYFHFEGGFCGEYLAFAAASSDESAFVSINMNDGTIGSMSADTLFSARAEENGVYLQSGNLLVKMDPATGEQTPLITTSETVLNYAVGEGRTVISSESGAVFFGENALPLSRFEDPDNRYTFDLLELAGNMAVIGSLNSDVVRVLKYESHPDTEVFSYDTDFEHNEARISADGKTVVLFRYDEFGVFDINGELIKAVAIPESETVYDQQFVRKDGVSELEVIYYSGKTDIYSGADGSLLRTEQRESHSKDIEDVFCTDKLKIVSPLHGAPQVYDKASGKLLTELSEDAYLTYVTQDGEYVIAQYMRTDGEFYGVLMNEKCETLAKLPYLCDVFGGELYFDYPTGNLRKSRIYILNELIAIAQINRKGDVT